MSYWESSGACSGAQVDSMALGIGFTRVMWPQICGQWLRIYFLSEKLVYFDPEVTRCFVPVCNSLVRLPVRRARK